jgi:hypothetical protein
VRPSQAWTPLDAYAETVDVGAAVAAAVDPATAAEKKYPSSANAETAQIADSMKGADNWPLDSCSAVNSALKSPAKKTCTGFSSDRVSPSS